MNGYILNLQSPLVQVFLKCVVIRILILYICDGFLKCWLLKIQMNLDNTLICRKKLEMSCIFSMMEMKTLEFRNYKCICFSWGMCIILDANSLSNCFS